MFRHSDGFPARQRGEIRGALRLNVTRFLISRPRVPPNPQDQRDLQRQPKPLKPGLSQQTRKPHLSNCHIDICRKHSDQKKYQAVRRKAAPPWQEQTYSARNLGSTTDPDKSRRPRQKGRHHA